MEICRYAFYWFVCVIFTFALRKRINLNFFTANVLHQGEAVFGTVGVDFCSDVGTER